MVSFQLVSFFFQQAPGASADDHVNIDNSNLQPELKYHVVHEIMNEQVQEVTTTKHICLDTFAWGIVRE